MKTRLGRRLATVAVLAAVVAAAFTWGFFVHRNRIFPYQLLRRVAEWSTLDRLDPARSWGTARDVPRAAGADVAALQYLPGYTPASGDSGVTIHDREHAAPGVNLYSSGNNTVAVLVDMDGRELHRWSLGAITAWSSFAPPAAAELVFPEWGFWPWTHMFPDGDLLVIYEGAGLLRLNARSEVEWAFWRACHHDFDVTPDGTILVLGRSWVDVPALGREEPVVDDIVWMLDSSGTVLDEVSVLQCLLASDYSGLLDLAPPEPDILHSNAVRLLDGRFARIHPAFAAGNLLVSMRTLNTVAVIDPERRRVVWAATGQWRGQHGPVLVDPGRLLLFDNQPGMEASRILEVDPLRRTVEWSYLSPGFSSDYLGAVQRLPGGTTLITESTHGRAFEITREGRIVWEFVNPERAGDDDELIATLFDVHRYPPTYFDFL